MAQPEQKEEEQACLPIMRVYQLKDPKLMIVVAYCPICEVITCGTCASNSTHIKWLELDKVSSLKLSTQVFLEWMDRK